MIQTRKDGELKNLVFFLSRNPVFALEMIQTRSTGCQSIYPALLCRNPVFALEMIQTWPLRTVRRR